MLSLILATFLAAQTGVGTNSINLAGGSGCNLIKFPGVKIDPAWTSFYIKSGIVSESSTWFNATRQFTGLWGTTAAKQQVLVRVGPESSGAAISLLLKSSAGVVSTWTWAGPMAPSNLKWPYMFWWTKDGTGKPRLYVSETAAAPMVEVPVVGPATSPLNLWNPTGQDWTLGGPDCLQKSVYDLQIGDFAPTLAEIETMWGRNTIIDVSLGHGPNPQGVDESFRTPVYAWLVGTGDVLPDVAPLLGGVHGTCYRYSGGAFGACQATLSTSIPVSPVSDVATDTIASYRFMIDSYTNPYNDHKHHGHSTAILTSTTSNEGVVVAHSNGLDHASNDQNVVFDFSDHVDVSFPYFGRPYPRSTAHEEVAFDPATDPPAGLPVGGWMRGNALSRLDTGRILEFGNYGKEPPILAAERWVPSRYSDGGMEGPWSDWTENADHVGTQWTSIGGGDAVIRRADGSLLRPYYYRDLKPGVVPPQSEGYYNIISQRSTDEGASWHFYGLVASGYPNKQWEEAIFVKLKHALGPLPAGTIISTMGLDYPPPRSTYWSVSFDDGDTWSAPAYAFEGRNWPIMIQLEHDPAHPVLALTRQPAIASIYGPCELFSLKDGLTWGGGLVLARAGEGSDVGHMLVEWSDGTVGVVMSHEKYNAAGGTQPSARTEYARLRKIW